MLKIYGRSNNTIVVNEVSKNHEKETNCNELCCRDRDAVISFTDGTEIRIGFGKDIESLSRIQNIWYIRLLRKGCCFDKLDVCMNEDAEIPSDIIYIDAAVDNITFLEHKNFVVQKKRENNKLVLTKEDFCKIMSSIKEQDKIDDEIGRALEKVCGSFVCYGTENKYLHALLKLLEIVFKDQKSQWIQWWLYEDVEKIVVDKTKEISWELERSEDLYDFLLSEHLGISEVEDDVD